MTMLSLQPRDLYHNNLPACRPLVPSPSFYYNAGMGNNKQGLNSPPPEPQSEVIQALEIARESADGGSDPMVSSILETAVGRIWAKVQAQPDSYVMTRDEFAVFNYFQARFTGNELAVAARKRYWNSMRA